MEPMSTGKGELLCGKIHLKAYMSAHLSSLTISLLNWPKPAPYYFTLSNATSIYIDYFTLSNARLFY